MPRWSIVDSPAVRVDRLDLRAIAVGGAFDHTPRAQVMITLRGTFVFEGSGARALIDANQVTCIPAGLVSRDLRVNDEPVSVLILTPASAVVEGLWRCEPQSLARRPEFRQLCQGQTTTGMLLAHRLASQVPGSLAAEECALALLEAAASPANHRRGRAACHDGDGTPGRRARDLVARVKELLATRPDLATVSAIAGEMGLNPVYLTQLFRRHEHVPISVYRSRLRLASALYALRDADDLARLALDLGYVSHSHFTTAFRRVYGETPSACRARLRGVVSPSSRATG